MTQSNRYPLLSPQTLMDLSKMLAVSFTVSFVTSYWITPVEGARQVLQLVDTSVTPSGSVGKNDDSGENDDESSQASFNTLWPIVMMLITGIIFIIIVVIVCKRFCRNNGRPEWGPRNRSLSLDGVRSTQTSTADRELRDQTSRRPGDGVWTVDMSIDCSIPGVSHLKPPPYCEKPPAYDDLDSLVDLPKYDTDNLAFTLDESLCELGQVDACDESMNSGAGTSVGTPAADTRTPIRVHVPRRYHISTSSSTCPNEPPPIYEPPITSERSSGLDNTGAETSIAAVEPSASTVDTTIDSDTDNSVL